MTSNMPTGPRWGIKPTLSASIRDGLVELIVSGELRSGERLVETKIAADFGTSQAPVREALRELESLGLVDSRPRRGRRVLPFVEQTLREAYVVRAALEEGATRIALSTARMPFDELGQDVADMERSARADDRHAMGLASSNFHRHVVLASNNFLLERAWEGLQIEARTAIALRVLGPNLDDVVAEHAELLAVMRAEDIEEACRHAREHQWNYAQLPFDVDHDDAEPVDS
ncbi:MAG: GntR family transcriptional regulator [Beutenbergiaceae bacterium]